MDEECLNASKRRKIEETVLQILEASDLETTTEFSVRAAAAERLGFGLSGLTHRRLVRQLIDSFLLSTAAAILGTTSLHRKNNGNNYDENSEHHIKQRQQLQLSDVGVGLEGNYNGKVICKLSDKRRVTIHEVYGTTMVSIRDFYIKEGNMLPQKGVNSGVSLTATQWSSFRNSFPSIQEAIVKLETRLRKHAVHPLNNLNCRSEAVAKQSEADVTNSVADSAVEKSQIETGISNLTSILHPPIKRKQTESEAETTNPVADSSSEKNQTQAGISNLINVKRKQTEADTSRSMTASNSQDHILAERKQEAAGASALLATSESQEQIPSERNQTEADISTLVPPFPTQGRLHDTLNAVRPERLIPDERKQTEDDISNSLPTFPTQGQLHYTVNVIRPERLIPIQTARLDGRNYHSWRRQMNFFLNQLNIAYVLAELCPSISPEASFDEKIEVKAAIQRWIDDDYLCSHHILNSLCDNLFELYSQKSYSAKELWEELKLTYDEDFGTKRSQINKYIHFQMVDGVSILEQVQELHKIADSVIASGTWIDENFHASVIVSKLPPSWKELRVRLMQEEFLPLNMLMHRLQVEEESRNCYKKETNYKKGRIIEPKLDYRLGMRKRDNNRVCYGCGKEGHINKNCPDRKFETREKSNEKENGVLSPCTGAKMVGAANTK
ncbi:hypothetical protein Pfo_001064 [Paulownia fortunei]|nr:hypothetical protein Pfo_001064 [Paulownia fortunei]